MRVSNALTTSLCVMSQVTLSVGILCGADLGALSCFPPYGLLAIGLNLVGLLANACKVFESYFLWNTPWSSVQQQWCRGLLIAEVARCGVILSALTFEAAIIWMGVRWGALFGTALFLYLNVLASSFVVHEERSSEVHRNNSPTIFQILKKLIQRHRAAHAPSASR